MSQSKSENGGYVVDTNLDIKQKKGSYWAREGAGNVYHELVSSPKGVNQIKSLVEEAIVLKYAGGYVLDAGTGTGRFARALAKVPGNSVVALDFSDEMIEKNRELSEIEGLKGIEFVQGDVEHLMFPDNHFDSVVSIAVVRHFPQWKNILKEYIRVLKPGGTLVFEVCSGDHIEAGNRIWPRFGVKYSDGAYYSFEAEVVYGELLSWLANNGVDVKERLTYDFFNHNVFQKIITINSFFYRVLIKIVNVVFRVPLLARIWAWLELKLLRYLPPACSYDNMIVGKKR
ncbi:class I SAM-dependent methyltransferase [Mariprofundus ferrooxydans]|uniref:class I SAM-dependent methyltransferase n=1 Tax=Mariprofundus ferrooxydans TaxID=314344 RepID=UPI00037BFBD4|nr:class I SAM-dependent methyltransferase [Mariprofundus ferrooxydans]